jgi:hypothetical protein
VALRGRTKASLDPAAAGIVKNLGLRNQKRSEEILEKFLDYFENNLGVEVFAFKIYLFTLGVLLCLL